MYAGDRNHDMGKQCNLIPGEGFESFAGFDYDVGYLGEYIPGNHDQVAKGAELIPLTVDNRAANDSAQVDFIEFGRHAVFPVQIHRLRVLAANSQIKKGLRRKTLGQRKANLPLWLTFGSAQRRFEP